jgi:hypothetical protein
MDCIPRRWSYSTPFGFYMDFALSMQNIELTGVSFTHDYDPFVVFKFLITKIQIQYYIHLVEVKFYFQATHQSALFLHWA